MKKVIKKTKKKEVKPEVGFNYQARKILDAVNKRIEEGREYFVKNSRGGRVYMSDKPKKEVKLHFTPKGTKPKKKVKKTYGKK